MLVKNLGYKKIFTKLILNLVAFSALFILCSRGLIEIMTDKRLAYLIQVVSVTIFQLSLIDFPKIKLNSGYKKTLMLFIIFIIVAILSYIYTLITTNFDGGWLYIIINIYLTFLMMINRSIIIEKSRLIRYDIIISIMIFILSLVAFLQQNAGLLLFLPGQTYTFGSRIRPSSLTGSYLHYPIVLVLLGFLMLQIFVFSKKRIHCIFSLIAFMMCILSFSRSGAFILFATIGIWFLAKFKKINKIKLKKVISMPIFLVFIAIILYYAKDTLYVERIVSSFSSHSPGNDIRIIRWKYALKSFFNTNIIIGEFTGLITNTTSNFNLISDNTVVESGLLQQLLNFGLLGTISYYMLFIEVTRNINKNSLWLKYAFIASVLQTFVYQSIEVLPFMFILCMFPQVSEFVVGKYRQNVSC